MQNGERATSVRARPSGPLRTHRVSQSFRLSDDQDYRISQGSKTSKSRQGRQEKAQNLTWKKGLRFFFLK